MIRYFILGLLFIITFLFSLSIGAYYIPFKVVLKVIFGVCPQNLDKTVILNIRLPRILFAILVGSGLSVAGASYQSIFKNPLVSPDILGVANGAAFGAVVAILLNINFYGLEVISFTFGILAVILAFLMTKNRINASILGLVISGIVVGALFTSLIGIVKYFADTNNQLPQIVFWLLGSFSFVSWNIWPTMIVIFVCTLIIYLMRWHLNIVSLNDEDAISLGVNIRLIKIIIITLSTIITAASVSIVGIVGWIGLIVPHLARLIVGSDNVKVIPLTIVIGGIFLLLSDDIARNLISGELPIGIITSLAGAPLFAYIYRTRIEAHE